MPLNPTIFQSADVHGFSDLAQRYHSYWSKDYPHLELDDHYKIRGALGKVLLQRAKSNDSKGIVAFCGTGPEIANNRDLDGTLLQVFLDSYPEVILSDFSDDTLRGSYNTIQQFSRAVAARTRLVIRDFSKDHASEKFDAMLSGRIGQLKTAGEMEAFLADVATLSDEDIKNYSMPQDHGLVPNQANAVGVLPGPAGQRRHRAASPALACAA